SAVESLLPGSGSVALATPRSTGARHTALRTASEAPTGTLPRQVLDNPAYHALLSGRRLDQLERRPIGGHESFILGNVFRDLGLAIGPVVEAGEIPDERRFVSHLGGAIKRQRGRLPCFVGDHDVLERVPLEMQMALRFGIFRG